MIIKITEHGLHETEKHQHLIDSKTGFSVCLSHFSDGSKNLTFSHVSGRPENSSWLRFKSWQVEVDLEKLFHEIESGLKSE